MSSAAQLREVGGALAARRECLAASPNPAAHLDYIVMFSGCLPAPEGGAFDIAVHYVPDRSTIGADAFTAYLARLAAQELTAAEEIGATVLSDFDSEIVPRYLRVSVAAKTPGAPRHEARFESRQPGWTNDGVLARLG